MGKKIGIDLGTTYSCMAYLNENGALEVIKNFEGSNTTPSIVFFESETNVVVGEQARSGALFNPENIVERIKSLMEDKHYTVEKFGTEYSPSAISSLILRKLKADAENALGEEIEGAVITCPAYFGTIARGATQKAAEDAGLKVYQIINEPTAAAFAYAYIKNEDVNKNVLIYDLGGGTFDCTLLRMDFQGDNKKLNVIASNGDHTLGGKDWDAAFTNYIINEFCSATGVDNGEVLADAEIMAWFSENVEKTKKQLSQREMIKVPVNFQGNKHIVEVTRDIFNSITEDLLNKTIDLVNAMLSENSFSVDSIDEIILVGGSTRMPQVEKRLTEEYNKPIIQFEPDEAVAKGAALMAAYAYSYEEGGASNDGDPLGGAAAPSSEGGAEEDRGFEIKLPGGGSFVGDDITNKSYGIKVYDPQEDKYVVVNIIKKGTTKPCSGTSMEIMPLVVGSAKSITVCESDYNEDIIDHNSDQDVFTGPLNITPGLPSDTPVEVVFDINHSGILEIKTMVAGVETRLVFDPTTGGASTAGSEAAKKLVLS